MTQMAHQKIQVLVVGDAPILKEGVKAVVNSSHDMIVFGESSTERKHLLEEIRSHSIDVLVLCASTDGAELIACLKQEFPSIPILVFNANDGLHHQLCSFSAGASGHLTVNVELDEMLFAIRSVADGNIYVSQEVINHLIHSLREKSEDFLHNNLSKREYQILILIGSGKSTSDIAKELELSIKTISTYRSRILDKLRLRSTGEIIHYAVSHDLV
jgi:two-component system, NarL family, invasion response regulator UvrY